MTRSLLLVATLCLLGCPRGSGGASADDQASPEAALAALRAAADAGDWGTYFDLTTPKDHERAIAERFAAVIADARGGSRQDVSVACLKRVGVDYTKLPHLQGPSQVSVEEYDAQRVAWRKALCAQVGDLRAGFVEALKLRESINKDPRFTPQKLSDPGRPGEITVEGDTAKTKTTHAGGGGAEYSWEVSFTRLDGKWYVDYMR